jgi:hypothetical protein
MILYFIGALAKIVLLKVGMLGYMEMSVALPYQTVLGQGFNPGCLSLGFLSGVGSLEQAGSEKWPNEGLVNEQSPAPSTHRASL